MTTVATVWGTHSNERAALWVGKSLANHPIAGVHAIPANRKAIDREERYIEMNMAYAYPGSRWSRCYEKREAARVLRKLKRLRPDVTCDIHSITNGEMHAVLNPELGVAPWVLGALKYLGVKYILTNKFNVHSHYRNAFGLEISSEDVDHRGIGFVQDFFNGLANNPNLPHAKAGDFTWFEYTDDERLHGLNVAIAHPDDFTDEERRLFGSFKPVPPRIQMLLGAQEQLYAQSNLGPINDQGFYTDLFKRAEVPNTSNWPR